MAEIVIQLSEPLDTPQGRIQSIKMREPRYADYMALASPVVWVVFGDGGYEHETPSVTQAWIERLVDLDPNLLEGLNFADTLELRDRVMGFFREGRAKRASMMSTPSPAPSSSASDGPTGPSKI